MFRVGLLFLVLFSAASAGAMSYSDWRHYEDHYVFNCEEQVCEVFSVSKQY
jgi:hypothetical protein